MPNIYIYSTERRADVHIFREIGQNYGEAVV